jgi:hypothetical protein
MRLSRDELDAVKMARPLGGMIGAHLKLSVPNAKGICEGQCLCNPTRGKKPFWVNAAAGTWGCLKGGCGGDHFAFLKQFEGLDFKSALARLGADASADPSAVKRLAAERSLREKESFARAKALNEAERRKAFEIWRRGIRAFGTVVDDYFIHRGLRSVRSASLRFSPDEPYWFSPPEDAAAPVILHRGPCMLAAIQGPDGKFRGLHMTWLDPAINGVRLPPDATGKASLVTPAGEPMSAKKYRGPKQGGAIRLHDFHEGPGEKVFLCGEGIETTETAYQACAEKFGRNYCAWAAGDLGNLAGAGRGLPSKHPEKPFRSVPSTEPDPDSPGVMPPPGTERAIILGDGDSDSLVTIALLTRARKRWEAAGVPTEIVMADDGKDFNAMARAVENTSDISDVSKNETPPLAAPQDEGAMESVA